MRTHLALILVLVGCRPRADPPEVVPVPVFAEREAPERTSCTSLLGPVREMFPGRLQIQLPIGVDRLAAGPSGALEVHDVALACVGGRVLRSLWILELPDDDPTLPVAVVRDALLEHLGYTDIASIDIEWEDQVGRELTCVVHLASLDILLGLRSVGGRMSAIAFEAARVDFEAMRPTLDASLQSAALPNP